MSEPAVTINQFARQLPQVVCRYDHGRRLQRVRRKPRRGEFRVVDFRKGVLEFSDADQRRCVWISWSYSR